ncbi:MAG TPA: TIR domain-containing protein [Pyrinomonadaceae bacterium]|nr:TIR domain-containing protein [Pyrinomonadaceae bacterium]
MANPHVFISHSSKDDAFVKELRRALEAHNIPTWVDSRRLSGGSKLKPEIEEAIDLARQFIAVLSPNTINSPWVRKEIRKALEVERSRKAEGYRVVPLLLPGIEPTALENWFDEEPVGVRVEVTKAGGLAEALPAILAALGERLPEDLQRVAEVVPLPVEELTLELKDLRVETSEGKRRARAVAQLVYQPSDIATRQVESRRYAFTAPLGVIEAEELRWYLEEYFVWPAGVFQERAERVEARLPEWGQALYGAALAPPAAQEALAAWQQAAEGAERRFSVFVERELPEGASEEEQAAASEAAAELLALPWELLHDGRGFLFHGKHPVRVRRRLPNRHRQGSRPTKQPIRVLLVSPRPEQEGVGYLDHRISALPLVEAVEGLGELAELTVLAPPTFGALEQALQSADEAGEPYDVVHFDGHGVYDPRVGLGALCFEDPNEVGKLAGRAMQLAHAERLAEVIREHRVPLVFLEACQSAKTDKDPTASVAARLLEEGVTSVVAMSHSVLVETARRFVGAFYRELARGRRVGGAMIAGQQELHRDSHRGQMLGAGELRLQDWFVPVLYQEEHDPQLVSKLLPEQVQQLQGVGRSLSLGELPEPPAHHFIGRSHELLALERLLHSEPWAVIRGQGGEGKTTLAAELARWLVRTGRFGRAAFVSLERYTDARGVLDSLGRQLLPEGDSYSVANYADLKQARQPIERALRDSATIIVLDNLESVLPDSEGSLPPGAAPIEELFDLCRKLIEADAATRLAFTTREPLPAPFDDRRSEIRLGPLGREDAVRLVSEVMKREGLEPKADDPGGDPREVTELVEAVGRHARALVLLSREVARRGVQGTTENLHRLMGEMHARFPGDRENSLYASVELSLRRLPEGSRERAKALALFHGGAHLYVLAHVLGAEPEEVMELARQLIGVGLAEDMGDAHLRVDPALPPYLLRGMGEGEREALRGRWAEAMAGLTGFLNQQQGQDASLSARLTLLELPNLLAMLRRAEEKLPPEEAVELAGSVERLLSTLGLPQAQAEAAAVRERAAQKLAGWGHARYLAARAEVDRLLDRGEVRAAYAVAERLLRRCQEAGEGAYPEAAYDLGMAHFSLGRVLRFGGAAAEALPLLAEARRRFEALARDGITTAARMAAATLTESGNCLKALGQLDEAAAAYEECVRRAEELGDQRGAAVAKGQLGSVRLWQRRYSEALAAHEEARRTFEGLGEPRSVAAAWHQTGLVHRQAGQYEQAERAYRQSLAIEVQQRNAAGEASSLNELGSLYGTMGRLEEAVKCFRQAADIRVRLQDQHKEGLVRNNLATVLLMLKRYDEARREVLRAIECKEPYGHAATPWTTWDILHGLESAAGDAEAAARARRRAVESYLAYRRDGGYGTTPAAQLCAAAAEAIAVGDTSELEQYLSRPLGEDAQPWAGVVFPKVLAVLRGERDPALAEDPELDYDAAVELLLLLEGLKSG